MRIAWFALVVTACGSSTSTPPPSTPPAVTSQAPPAATGAAQAAAPAAAPASPYPVAEKHPVTDHYGDVAVVDDYRWLEDAKDPRVVAWTAAQNQLTRSRLDALPDRPKIRARVAELMSNRAPSWYGLVAIGSGSGVLALERHPPKQQQLLVAFADPAKPAERVVLDPNELDPSGHTAIDFFVPSLDGKRVGVSLSTGGSESGDVHVYDLATGKPLPDVVPRVNGGTAGGSMAWNGDGSGFYYTRYPHDGERPAEDLDFYQQIYFHKLGTPVASDVYVLGKEFPRIAEVVLRTSKDGRSVLATVGNGDGGEYALYVIEARGDGRGRAVQVSKFADKLIHGEFAPDGTLYVISHQGAPKGAVLRLRRPYTGTPERVVAEGDGVIEEIAPTASRLYLAELVGGPSRLRSVRLAGAAAPEPIATPLPVASIGGLEPYGRDDLLYETESYVATPGWFRLAAATGKSAPTALVQAMPFAMDDIDVVRDTCTSADGTKVPISILVKRGLALDGSHPALLTGYGGYRISMTPSLSALSRMWLDQGGVWAIANLRGGNEFGEAWNEAGRLTQKQHVFDDFYACARALVDKRYTRPDRLAITGRSNGGLLMGAALTQHPEMYRAVVSGVGIYDSLRFELTANGSFNITELGTVKNPEQFRALYAYSPYHHVKDGVAYPAILMTTGANDPRVDPYNSRKMTARMQAANPGGHLVLLRAADDVGHGMGSPLAARIEETADSFAFVMHELGMHYTE